MMRKAVVFEASRDGYGIDQLRNPMTIREFIEVLEELEENYGEDALLILSHDKGYTYGSLTKCCEVRKENESGDFEYYDEYEVW